jgi:hypothetical protein
LRTRLKRVMKLDGEICVLWFQTLQSHNFRPYSLIICFLQVNVKSIQERHATIRMKDILITFSLTQSYDTWMKADIHKEHFCTRSPRNAFWTLELSTLCTCCKRTTKLSPVPHKISPASFSKTVAISSYNTLRVNCEIELFEVGQQEIMLGINVRRSWRPAPSTADALWKSVVQDRAAKYITGNVTRRHSVYVGFYHAAERIFPRFPAPWI